MKELSIDEVFDAIGHLGQSQVLYLSAISVVTIFLAFHMVLNIFTGLEPNFYCIPLEAMNTSSQRLASLHGTVLHSSALHTALHATDAEVAFLRYSRVNHLQHTASHGKTSGKDNEDGKNDSSGENNESISTSDNNSSSTDSQTANSSTVSSSRATIVSTLTDTIIRTRAGTTTAGGLMTQEPLRDECPNDDVTNCRIIYDPGYISIVQEWGLVCNNKYRVAAVQSVWMLGVMMGAVCLAGLPDKYGRSSTLFVAVLGTVLFEGLAGFTMYYVVYVALRFLGGMMACLMILANFVLSQEIVGNSKRSIAGVMGSIMFSIGIALLAAIASYSDHWRELTLYVSIAGMPLLALPFLVPESPRWLVSQGRVEEAQEVMMKMARRNNALHRLPQEWRLVDSDRSKKRDAEDSSMQSDWFEQKAKAGGKQIQKLPHKLDEKSTGLVDLLRHGYIFKIVLIQIYSWFVNSAVYYGLTMAASSLGSNVYLSTALNGIVEIPGAFLTVLIIDRLGRRVTLVGFMLCGGAACLVIPFIGGHGNTVTALALIGKLSISGSFTVAYVHSGEIFPTVVRNAGMGLVAVAARIGGIVSPFILMLDDVWPSLQYALLGVMAVSSGLLNMLLPETLGRAMPNTVLDVLAFRDQHKVTKPEHRYSKLEDGQLSDMESDEEGEVVELDRTSILTHRDKQPLVD